MDRKHLSSVTGILNLRKFAFLLYKYANVIKTVITIGNILS